ncbi:MAG TPA: ribonuclease H family protein [Candidatus Paceibacterota bacterium]
MSAKKKKFYAYFVPGGKTGVADSWAACEKIVSGKTGARFRGFDSKSDAEAWLLHGALYEAKASTPRPNLKPGIYFDAGTGRGAGVEISVTDEQGKNLLHKAIAKKHLNKFGKHLLKNDEATNNYGELLALSYALEIARAIRVKYVFGDSKLVIEFWSQRRIKRKDLPEETVALADEVSRAREVFEKSGGTVERISGDFNPADLGFHR